MCGERRRRRRRGEKSLWRGAATAFDPNSRKKNDRNWTRLGGWGSTQFSEPFAILACGEAKQFWSREQKVPVLHHRAAAKTDCMHRRIAIEKPNTIRRHLNFR